MNRIGLVIILMVLGTGMCFGNEYTEKIESMRDHYDPQGLQIEYDLLMSLETKDSQTLYRLGKTTGFLFECKEALNEENPGNDKLALESIDYLERSLSSNELGNADAADAACTIALMYYRMISDAASWMKYNSPKEKYLNLCLQNDPRHAGARLITALSLMYLPGSEDDPEKGRTILATLQAENPDNLQILTEVASDLMKHDKKDEAETIYLRIVSLYPECPPARRTLEELSIMKEGPTIKDILIEGHVKTSRTRILRKTASLLGSKYTAQTKEEIISRILEIRSITGCTIEVTPIGNNEVKLNIGVTENNMRMIGALPSLGLSLDYDGDVSTDGSPLFMYIDQNIFGTADTLNVLFAGIYAKLDYFNPGLFDDKYPDLKFQWEAMFTNQESIPIEDGRAQDDLAIKSPYHLLSISFGRESPIGFSAFAGASVKYENWTTDRGDTGADFTVPDHHITYTPFMNLSFSTVGQGSGSKMDIPEGFTVQINPEVVYIPEYSPWGKKGALHEHDPKPAVRFNAGFYYSKKLFEQQNVRINTLFMTGSNLYETEKWKTGKGMLLLSEASLDGYFSDEFTFTSGVVNSLTYQINVLPSTLAGYVKYDIFLNLDDSSIYQGTALGLVTRLPFDIELVTQLGIGLNAERARGPGYEFDMSLMKTWAF